MLEGKIPSEIFTSIYISVDGIYMRGLFNFKITIVAFLEVARPFFVVKCIVSHLFSSVYAGINAAMVHGLLMNTVCYIPSRGC